jgi:predicted PurR-regulated permease PerM
MSINLEERFLAILLLIALVGLLWLFSPFLEALFFAMILATATYSIYEKVLIKVKGSETLASSLTSLAIFLSVIAPVTYLLLEVGLQAGQLYGQAQDWLSVQTPESFKNLNQQLIGFFPLPEATQGQLLQQLQENSANIIKFAKDAVVFLAQGIFGSTASFLTFMLLAVFALYFFYRDGKKIAVYLINLSPLDNFYDRMIISRFSNLSTILLLSVLSIAVMQGVSFALLSWVLGLPGLFLGMAIAVTSFIPIVGSAIVWVPVSILLASQGDYTSAGIVAFMGAVINGFIIDNVLRPIVINKIAHTLDGAKEDLAVANHTLITVLSTFAGLIHFGIIGLFFGPVIAAIAITIFDVYAHKHSEILDKKHII